MINLSISSWPNRIVPVAVKSIWHRLNLGIRSFIGHAFIIGKRKPNSQIISLQALRVSLSAMGQSTEENRGNCPSFEPLLNAFLEILLNNNTELQLVQELARKYA